MAGFCRHCVLSGGSGGVCAPFPCGSCLRSGFSEMSGSVDSGGAFGDCSLSLPAQSSRLCDTDFCDRHGGFFSHRRTGGTGKSEKRLM